MKKTLFASLLFLLCLSAHGQAWRNLNGSGTNATAWFGLTLRPGDPSQLRGLTNIGPMFVYLGAGPAGTQLAFLDTNGVARILLGGADFSLVDIAGNMQFRINTNGITGAAVQISTNGGIMVGANTEAHWGGLPVNGETLVSVRDTLLGEANYNELYLETRKDAQNWSVTDILQSTNQNEFYVRTSLGGDVNEVVITTATNTAKVEVIVDGNVIARFDTNGFFGNGAGLTNLIGATNFPSSVVYNFNGKTTFNAVSYNTNKWDGPTNTLVLSTNYQDFITTTDCNITNIGGQLARQNTWATLTISNASASDITVRSTAAGIRPQGSGTTAALVIGAGKEGILSYLCRDFKSTNYVTTAQQ